MIRRTFFYLSVTVLLFFIKGCGCMMHDPYCGTIDSVHSDKDYVIIDYSTYGDRLIEGSKYTKCECSRIEGLEWWYRFEISQLNEQHGRTFSRSEPLPPYEILSREIIPAKGIFENPEIRYKIRVARKQLGI